METASGVSSRFRVLGDQPYDRDDDPFGFDRLADELTRLILASRTSTPFTVGIEASWGRGKSSLMAQLARRLPVSARETAGVDVRTVTFNAWTAEGRDVLEGLVKSVLEAMDPNILRRALRRRNVITWLKIPVLLLAGWLRVGALVDEAWERLSVDARTRNQVNDVVREAMAEWLASASAAPGHPGPGRMVVVFIDDLDRVSPHNVLLVFEALKLYLDAPGFVFVIGYDEGVIVESVREQRSFSARATGRDYIEKIVQMVFRIPQPSDEEVAELLDRYLQESGTAQLIDETGRELIIDRNGRNPRRIKRFLNRFILDYELDEASRDLEPGALIKLLILETYFPEFAALLLVEGRKENPFDEFVLFVEARTALRRGESGEVVQRALRSQDLLEVEGEAPAETLARLEREVPEPFVPLGPDQAFGSLVASIADRGEQDVIVGKVRRRRARTGPDVEAPMAKMVGQPPVPAADAWTYLVGGQDIFWVDDHPENHRELVDRLNVAGARVVLMRDGHELRELMSTAQPNVLISDIARGDSYDTGLEELGALRGEQAYAGPAIFYAPRVSAAQRERARQLDATVVQTAPELLAAIAVALSSEVATPESAVPA